MSNLDQEARDAIAWLESEFERRWNAAGRVYVLEHVPGETLDETCVPVYYYILLGHSNCANGGMMSLKK